MVTGRKAVAVFHKSRTSLNTLRTVERKSEDSSIRFKQLCYAGNHERLGPRNFESTKLLICSCVRRCGTATGIIGLGRGERGIAWRIQRGVVVFRSAGGTGCVEVGESC